MANLNTGQLISKLNFFYSLEMNQVDLYMMQSKLVSDLYIKKVLERVAEIEQAHVINIGEKIRGLGGTPSFVGELVAPLTGKVAGLITGWSGILAILKADIGLEEKAMKEYREFIIRAGADEDLFKLLWGNLIDEDLHTSWFASKVAELESINK